MGNQYAKGIKDKMGNQGKGRRGEPEKGAKNPPKKTEQHQPGEGIRSMKTSSAFRALNFELYARPNKTVMIIGGLAMTSCILYLGYMRWQIDQKKYYLAQREDGEVHLIERKSRWDS